VVSFRVNPRRLAAASLDSIPLADTIRRIRLDSDGMTVIVRNPGMVYWYGLPMSVWLSDQ
jgi:hypothetical protein